MLKLQNFCKVNTASETAIQFLKWDIRILTQFAGRNSELLKSNQ